VRNSEYAYYLHPADGHTDAGERWSTQRLFDVQDDFRETTDILNQKPEVASTLHNALLQEFGMWTVPATPEVDDPALRQRLRDLGYL